jgi:hypothetical protein
VLQEQRLDAENKRFAAGMSTNFLVTQAQRDLAISAVAELRAIADYWKSLANLDRAQVAGGGTISFSTGRSPASTTALALGSAVSQTGTVGTGGAFSGQ